MGALLEGTGSYIENERVLFQRGAEDCQQSRKRADSEGDQARWVAAQQHEQILHGRLHKVVCGLRLRDGESRRVRRRAGRGNDRSRSPVPCGNAVHAVNTTGPNVPSKLVSTFLSTWSCQTRHGTRIIKNSRLARSAGAHAVAGVSPTTGARPMVSQPSARTLMALMMVSSASMTISLEAPARTATKRASSTGR